MFVFVKINCYKVSLNNPSGLKDTWLSIVISGLHVVSSSSGHIGLHVVSSSSGHIGLHVVGSSFGFRNFDLRETIIVLRSCHSINYFFYLFWS